MKSKIFKGQTAADVSRRVRRDVSLLASLPTSKVEALGKHVLEAARASEFSSRGRLKPSAVRGISEALGLETEQVERLGFFSAYLGAELAETGAEATEVAEDLIEIGSIAADKEKGIHSLLKVIQDVSAYHLARRQKGQTASGGGYHVHSLAFYPELRVWSAEADLKTVSAEKYVPKLLGFVPTVTLELGLNDGENSEVVSVRLDEDDLDSLEESLKIAKKDLLAAKKRLEELRR